MKKNKKNYLKNNKKLIKMKHQKINNRNQLIALFAIKNLNFFAAGVIPLDIAVSLAKLNIDLLTKYSAKKFKNN